jgi:hypothetical protein
MESLSSELGGVKEPTIEEMKEWLSNTRILSKTNRLQVLRKALTVLIHPSRHADDNAAGIDWRMVDARSILVMSASLIAMFADDKGRRTPPRA